MYRRGDPLWYWQGARGGYGFAEFAPVVFVRYSAINAWVQLLPLDAVSVVRISVAPRRLNRRDEVAAVDGLELPEEY